ncbi:MAG TPA: endonuclease/exonuclease/phosphatase family protein [Bacteroidales bacterium]|nr:endonuclease/exonuclease/phosphatase family protein [Bacteroidales bacterium]
MKKRILFLLSLICLGIFPAWSSSIRVMTFNIRYANPDDGNYSWPNRKPMVLSMLEKEQPDIIGFQEVLHSQLMDLAGSLKEYNWSGVGRDDGKEQGEYSVIFYRKDRFEKEDGSTFWLSETPEVPGSRSWNAACNRIVTWVKLKEKRTGMEFFVFNTHFDHASAQAREESARLILARVGGIAGNTVAVVTGDFNDTAGSVPYRLLTQGPGGLLDSGLLAKEKTGPDYSFIGFPFKPEPGNLIDFVLFHNLDADLIRSHAVITYNENGLYPSDHLPVLTVFDIP